jgi:hypothetical protein
VPDSGRAMAIQVRAPTGLKIGIRFPYTNRYTEIDCKRILPYTDKYTKIKMGYVLQQDSKLGFDFHIQNNITFAPGLKIGIRFPYTDKYTEIKMGYALRAPTGLKLGIRFPYTDI